SSSGTTPTEHAAHARRSRPMRALGPRVSGTAADPCDGVGVAFEVFGPVDAERTVVFAPAGLFAHGRLWKMQVPFFALRGYRGVTYDARGSGRSDRPEEGYTPQRFQEDLLAVLREVGVERAAFVGMTWALRWLGPLAAERPELVSHLVTVGSFPSLQRAEPCPPSGSRRAWRSSWPSRSPAPPSTGAAPTSATAGRRSPPGRRTRTSSSRTRRRRSRT